MPKMKHILKIKPENLIEEIKKAGLTKKEVLDYLGNQSENIDGDIDNLDDKITELEEELISRKSMKDTLSIHSEAINKALVNFFDENEELEHNNFKLVWSENKPKIEY